MASSTTREGRDRALNAARELIAAAPARSARRDHLVRMVADRLDVPVDYVEARAGGPDRRAARAGCPPQPAAAPRPGQARDHLPGAVPGRGRPRAASSSPQLTDEHLTSAAGAPGARPPARALRRPAGGAVRRPGRGRRAGVRHRAARRGDAPARADRAAAQLPAAWTCAGSSARCARRARTRTSTGWASCPASTSGSRPRWARRSGARHDRGSLPDDAELDRGRSRGGRGRRVRRRPRRLRRLRRGRRGQRRRARGARPRAVPRTRCGSTCRTSAASHCSRARTRCGWRSASRRTTCPPRTS